MNNKKIKAFLENNFPTFDSFEITKNTDDIVVAVLEYGKKDKIRVTIGYSTEAYGNYRLLRTDFI